MKSRVFQTLLTTQVIVAASTLTVPAHAAPSAILTRVSGSVAVLRGGKKLPAKNGLALQNGDKVTVTNGSATVFTLGAPPKTLTGGSFVVGNSASGSGSSGLWKNVYAGLQKGLDNGNRTLAATMRRKPVITLISPIKTKVETARPRFAWEPKPGVLQYEIAILKGGKDVFRTQTKESFLPYPPEAPALSGTLTWSVTPLELTDGKWTPRTDINASDATPFTIATLAEVAAVSADLKTLEAQLKAPVEKALARASLWYGAGFLDAALRELAKVPNDSTAVALRDSILGETGRSKALPTSLAKVSIGKAVPTYLALAPDGPYVIDRVKTYRAPDGHFALDLPEDSCESHYELDNAHFFDFAPSIQSGARLTLVYGSLDSFPTPDALLTYIKDALHKIDAKPESNGTTHVFDPSVRISFRGKEAFQTNFKSITARQRGLGQTIAWQENGEVFLFLTGDADGSASGINAFRPLLNSLKLGSSVPTASEPQINVQSLPDEGNSVDHEYSAAIDKISRISQDFQLEAPVETASGKAPDLESLDQARLATPEDSHERSTAAHFASTAAAREAWDALEKGDNNLATTLFHRSADLDRESYHARVTAYEADIKSVDAKIDRWTAITPPQIAQQLYSGVLDQLRGLQTIQLDQLRFYARQYNDTARLDSTATRLFELQRVYLLNQRLSKLEPAAIDQRRNLVASSLEVLGKAAEAHADLDGARAYYARALDWRKAVAANFTDRDLNTSLSALGALENNLGDLGLARDFYQQAIADQNQVEAAKEKHIAAVANEDLREKAHLNWLASRALNLTNLGNVTKKLGDFTQAEKLHLSAIKILESLPETGYPGVVRSNISANIYQNLAVLHNDSGDGIGGAKFFNLAAELYRGSGNQSGLAEVLFSDAAHQYDLGNVPEARSKLGAARTLYQALQRPRDLMECDILAAKIADIAADRAESIQMAERALQLAHTLGEAQSIGAAARKLAFSELYAVGSAPLTPAVKTKVSALIQEVMSAAARTGSSAIDIQNFDLRSKFAEMQGNLEQALDLKLAAISRSERVRASVIDSAAYAEQETNYRMYEDAVHLLLALDRPEEAFDMLSRARSKKLRDNMQISAMKSNDPVLQKLLARASSLDERLSKARAQLTQANADATETRDAEKVANLQQLIASTQAEFFKVSAQIKAKNPRFDEVLSLTPTELKKAQKSIPAGALLLQYAPLGDGLYIFAVTKNSLQIFKPEGSKTDLDREIRAYRAAIDADLGKLAQGAAVQNIDDAASPLRQASEKLSKWLLDPVRKEIAAAKVVAIVPSGELFYLPFHTLGDSTPDGKWHFLIEDKPVAYLAKGDVLSVALDRDAEDQGRGILALGDPTGAQLPAAKLEVESIAKIFPDSRALTGDGASKAVLLQPDSRDNKVLHLAAHGVLNSAKPDQSFIQLAPSKNDDGKLRVGEILGIDLNKVDLVTLSACQTALGEGNPDGTEISSLAQSFSTAGTPSVIASLWNVEDKSTQRLMETFYGALADGVPKGAALQKAQVTLLKDPKTRNPVFWAPFELLGDWR